jgi:hypothetical protein
MPVDMPAQSDELLAIQSRAIACHQGAGAGINPRAMRTRMGQRSMATAPMGRLCGPFR